MWHCDSKRVRVRRFTVPLLVYLNGNYIVPAILSMSPIWGSATVVAVVFLEGIGAGVGLPHGVLLSVKIPVPTACLAAQNRFLCGCHASRPLQFLRPQGRALARMVEYLILCGKSRHGATWAQQRGHRRRHSSASGASAFSPFEGIAKRSPALRNSSNERPLL